ncbi:hypothetical protein Poly51_03550 [Rubripirellula tenax]|uniref:Uncharacterized protein n=1 Tax=Rubripirellula tenax TaxID=2528015 RepID=A0A5C6FEZ6_9BACT|nr:hypothetical protein Poly51_03550 [Rubripirellula tenax]
MRAASFFMQLPSLGAENKCLPPFVRSTRRAGSRQKGSDTLFSPLFLHVPYIDSTIERRSHNNSLAMSSANPRFRIGSGKTDHAYVSISR